MKCESCKKQIGENSVTMKVNGLNWSNSLLDNGAQKTQGEWRVWCKQNGYRLPTQTECVELVRTLLEQSDSEFKKDVFSDLKKYWLMTGEILPCLDGKERALVLGVGGVNYGFSVCAIDVINNVRPARGVELKYA